VSEQAQESTVDESTPDQEAQEASAALNAGYNKARGIEPPTDVDDAGEQAPGSDEQPGEKKEAQEGAAQEAAPDPWEGVPKIVRDSIERVSVTANQVGAAQRHIKVLEGHIDALRQAGEAAKAAAPAGTDAPTARQIQAAAASGEKWNQIKEDFPEWAEAMDERLAALSPQTAAIDMEAIQKQLAQSTQAQISGAIDAAEERAFVRLKYPDWKTTVATDGFEAWKSAQAPEIQALADSELADDAIRLLNAYAEHQKAATKAADQAAARAAAEAKNKRRLAANAAPETAASGGPSILPDEAGLSVGYNRIKRRAQQ